MELVVQPLQRVLTVQPGANLLAVLREHQVPMSYSCTAGRCGTCRCRVIEGEVLETGKDLPQPTANDSEFVLACQTFLTQSCTIEIPEPDEIVVHPARILKASVVVLEALTHDVTRLVIKPTRALEYSPGQYAQLQFSPEHVRPYSMAGLCTDESLEFHVRHMPEGRVSGYVATRLKVGDNVKVSGPLGSAYLRRKEAGPMLCVAGGTGLAPILSIARGALAGGMTNPIHLYFGVRSSRDLYGVTWLAALQEQHPNLRVQVVIAGSDAGPGQRAGLVTDAIAQDLPDLSGWRAYLCGSPPMVEAATLVVTRSGLAPQRIHADAFYPQAI